MRLDLSEIVARPGMKSAVEVDQECVPDPDLNCLAPVQGRVEFLNSGNVLLIDGDVATTLELSCSRCLEPLAWPVTVHLEERFPLEDVIQPPKEPSEAEEFDTTISSVVHLELGKPILDLDELIRQQLITEIPLRALCDEACRGLCPQCGVNRNVTECQCAPSTEDSPFAGLASLMEPEQNGS
jgi:uncharacterized protein